MRVKGLQLRDLPAPAALPVVAGWLIRVQFPIHYAACWYVWWSPVLATMRTVDDFSHSSCESAKILVRMGKVASTGRGRAVPTGQILPATAAAQHEEDALERLAIVSPRPPGLGAWWEEWLDDGPLAVVKRALLMRHM